MTFTNDYDALKVLADESAHPSDKNDAFAFLMAEYYGPLCHQVQSVLRINPRLAGQEGDIIQETFIRLLSKVPDLVCSERFTPELSLFPWLSRVAFRRALDALRRPGNRRVRHFGDHSDCYQAPSEGSAGGDSAVREVVEQALPPVPARVFVLHYFE